MTVKLCKRGHRMTPDNTRRDGRCRQCYLDIGARRRAERTHCRNGHAMTPENTRHTKSGKVECRACAAIRRERHAAARAAYIAAGVLVKCANGHDLTLPGAVVKSTGRCRQCDREAGTRYLDRKLRGGRRPTPSIVCGRKFCPGCGRWLLLLYFPLDTSRDRLRGSCESCIARRRRDKYEAIMADPVQRELHREFWRFRAERLRRAAGIPERNWSENSRRGGGPLPRVDPEPLLTWLEEYEEQYGTRAVSLLADAAGSDRRTIYALRHGEAGAVHLGVVDRILTAAGDPLALHDLYPLKEAA